MYNLKFPCTFSISINLKPTYVLFSITRHISHENFHKFLTLSDLNLITIIQEVSGLDIECEEDALLKGNNYNEIPLPDCAPCDDGCWFVL
jgi:hypothetical protein